jgi:hypothetical protein
LFAPNPFSFHIHIHIHNTSNIIMKQVGGLRRLTKLAIIAVGAPWWQPCSSFTSPAAMNKHTHDAIAIRRSSVLVGHSNSNFHSSCAALSVTSDKQRRVFESSDSPDPEPKQAHTSTDASAGDSRRQVLASFLSTISTALIATTSTTAAWAQAPASRPRAVGGAELECRANGNCLETFDLDGAIGWQWGAKDRCDASDPLCGADGRLMEAPPTGAAVPSTSQSVSTTTTTTTTTDGLDTTTTTNDSDGNVDNSINIITHVASIELMIGKDNGASQQGTLKMGLYGNAFPDDVARLIEFMDARGGIITSNEPGFGMVSTPVSLARGGILAKVFPRQKIEFGIPSQRAAYAKRVGRPNAGDLFTPQPLPPKTPTSTPTSSSRPHDCAGLVSVAAGGVGNGGGLGPDDEAFANAFQITATAVPGMDRDNRKVIGQLLDSSSMALLERLASLPPNKGLKGVLPGQSNGPPLLKVTVTDTNVLAMENTNTKQ